MEKKLICLVVCFCLGIQLISSMTDSGDSSVLVSLRNAWRNTPPSWAKSDDPCGAWEGVSCINSRVISLSLSSMGLQGELVSDIELLTELDTLDLSSNKGLIGSLSPRLGDLINLRLLILAGCSFSGNIPSELGNLSELSFLALNANHFSGVIPHSLGKLTNLFWLDLSDNRLTGQIPVSTGLDLLKNAKHFHFNNNNLSGSIPWNLANNLLTGPLPDLSGMNSLSFIDLSNNSFMPSEAPMWFTTLQSITTLAVENGNLHGSLPQKLFSLPHIKLLKIKNNAFNNTLDMGLNVSQQLELVDLQNNDISSLKLDSRYKKTLILTGNPVCDVPLANATYCQLETKPYSTSVVKCGKKSCSSDQKLSPQNCNCAYPYEGTLHFRAPSFRELSNATLFHKLEVSMWTKLALSPGTVSLQNPFFNVDDQLQIQLQLFPSPGMYFNTSEIMRLGFALSNQTYKPPKEFGPFFLIASPYVNITLA